MNNNFKSLNFKAETDLQVKNIENKLFSIDLFYGSKFQQRPLKAVLHFECTVEELVSSTASNLSSFEDKDCQIVLYTEDKKYWLGQQATYIGNLATSQELLNSCEKEKIIVKCTVKSAVHYYIIQGELKSSPKISLLPYSGKQAQSKKEYIDIEDVWNF